MKGLTRYLNYVKESFRIDRKDIFDCSTGVLSILLSSLSFIGFIRAFSPYFILNV